MGKSKIKTSRRNFFKKSALLSAGFLAASATKPFSSFVIASEPKNESDFWFGMGMDIEKCIGCGRCAKACKDENDVPKHPFYFRSWVEQYTITNDQEVKVESPNGGIDGFKQSVPDEEIFKTFFVPKMCNHCTKSPCEQVCPVGAAYMSPEGVVLVDDKYCIGCRYCIQACPYGCRYMHPERKVIDKCTLCYHRIKKGLKPACVEVCPTKTRIFGNLRDKNSELVAFMKSKSLQVLKPHTNTHPKVYYNALNKEVR